MPKPEQIGGERPRPKATVNELVEFIMKYNIPANLFFTKTIRNLKPNTALRLVPTKDWATEIAVDRKPYVGDPDYLLSVCRGYLNERNEADKWSWENMDNYEE